MSPVAKPFTPETLAERWGCSPNHVRNLVNRRKLRAFRAGRLIRIPAEAVEDFEQCPNTDSDGSTAGTSSPGMTTPASDTGIVLIVAPERKPRAKPSMSSDAKQQDPQPA